MALLHHTECDHVSVAEALADLDGLGCHTVCRFEVTSAKCWRHTRESDVAVLDAIVLPIEQPLPACEPAGRRCALAA